MSTDVKPKFDRKEYMKKYAQEKLECKICGGTYDKNHASDHIRTKKHQYALMLLEQNNNEIPQIGKRTEEKVEIKKCDVCYGTYLPNNWKLHCTTKTHIRAENHSRKK